MTEEEYWNLHETCANCTWENHGHETFGWWAQTHHHELWDLIKEVSAIGPERILEIGTNHGGTAIFWDQLLGSCDKKLITIDQPEGFIRHTSSLFDSRYSTYKPLSDFTALQGDSHSRKMWKEVCSLFGKSFFSRTCVDFLYIDGDHSYEGAKLDYKMYGPLVRPGGIIAIDDVVIIPEMAQMWKELDGNKKILPVPNEGHGIGIIYV
jgi:predicted O-methyltransferase YrrM